MRSSTSKLISISEITDYRGNLCFVEEGNPIPFDIKSVFWTTLHTSKIFALEAQSFIIILDGTVNLNEEVLNRPNLAYFATGKETLKLKLISQEAKLLIITNQSINSPDESTSKEQLLQMPKTNDFYGLSGYFANSKTTLPFDIKRIYFTYNIPDFAKRGGHAHKKLTSIVFAAKGSFNLILDDKAEKTQTTLNTQNTGLHITSGIWREIETFAPNSIVLVLASEKYEEKDYIRNYKSFKNKH